ncbi:rod shape-determining protein RodA [Patescibacteria group bacterium]|nr:rod shape-determining protein RodA [Patescibacteria group bacterium]
MNFRDLDWPLNGSVLFIFCAGLLSLASAARNLFWLQIGWGVLAGALILFAANFDWRSFIGYKWFIFGIYAFSMLLLIATDLFAPSVLGHRGWLPLGPIRFQTSELAKLALILVLSYFFAKRHVGIAYFKTLFISFVYFVIPATFILITRDMGTALILFGIWFGYLLVSGIRWRHLFYATIIGVIGLTLLWHFGLKQYQKDRIIGLFNPQQDPLGMNYNVIQAKIAVGSAGIFGKGFGQGTQTELGFLPVAQTDFMFAAFTEEWGLVGISLVLLAFSIMLYRIVRIALGSDNNFFKLVALGASLMFLLHFIVNTGSNLGIMPVIGVSFPFLSYGGSNLVISALLIGIVQSSALHKRF